MGKQELLNKLAQIEGHANNALAEFPQLAKERLRMIIALTRQLRSEMSDEADPVSAAGLRTSQDDDGKTRSG